MKFNPTAFLIALILFAGVFFLLDFTVMNLQGLGLIFDDVSAG